MMVVDPVILGILKRFFADGSPARSFQLVGAKAMPSAIILTSYEVVGPLPAG